LHGNPGKRRINRREPKPQPGVPSCPEHLNEVARREWRRVTRELKAVGLVSKLDRAALAGYCDAYARWVEASNNLQQFGLILKSPSGFPIQSPYLAIVNRSLEQMRSFMVEFGMTPSSRCRIEVEQPHVPNRLDKFLL
jgi:P27 family predicted phage terminase small subunit